MFVIYDIFPRQFITRKISYLYITPTATNTSYDTHKQYGNEEMEDKWPNYINQRTQEDIWDINLTKYSRQTDDLTLRFIPKSKNLNIPLIWL